MLTLTVPASEAFDERTNEFITSQETKLVLEHSLVALYKWESKWEIPFLADKAKTTEQTLDYIRMMNIEGEIPPEVFANLSDDNVKQVNEYISAKMTATWFAETPNVPGKTVKKEIVTAEIIYYWMVAMAIPFECQYWHLNKLLTLIKVCNEKNKPEDKKQKMSRADLAARNRALNEQRKAELKTRG